MFHLLHPESATADEVGVIEASWITREKERVVDFNQQACCPHILCVLSEGSLQGRSDPVLAETWICPYMLDPSDLKMRSSSLYLNGLARASSKNPTCAGIVREQSVPARENAQVGEEIE
jgi:hypothetical protein